MARDRLPTISQKVKLNSIFKISESFLIALDKCWHFTRSNLPHLQHYNTMDQYIHTYSLFIVFPDNTEFIPKEMEFFGNKLPKQG